MLADVLRFYIGHIIGRLLSPCISFCWTWLLPNRVSSSPSPSSFSSESTNQPASSGGFVCSNLKALPLENNTVGSQFTLTKSDGSVLVKDVEKGSANQFTISSGFREKTQQVRASVSVQPNTIPEYQSHLESGFCQAVVYPKYPYGDQLYGVISAYEPQMAGRVMLPLDLTTDEWPIYVNAKQYHGIIRRRLHRAKAELVKRSIRARKPYMHESRHLHALRRPRGGGGRFLNTKITDGAKGGHSMKSSNNGLHTQPTVSPHSEILQSDSGTLNSPKHVNISGSEATSLYTREDLHGFNTNYMARPLPVIVDSGHVIVSSNHWASAAQNCCNLNA